MPQIDDLWLELNIKIYKSYHSKILRNVNLLNLIIRFKNNHYACIWILEKRD